MTNSHAISSPDIITAYHYTDQNGLYGILHDREIWATHYRFLNDSTELNDLLLLLREESHKESSVPKNKISDMLDTFQNIYEKFDVYIVSFTEDILTASEEISNTSGDRLSQWRGYAEGRQGFSLGFSFTESFLRKLEIKGNENKRAMAWLYYGTCLYKTKDKLKDFYKVLYDFSVFYEQNPGLDYSNANPPDATAYIEVLTRIFRLICFSKHEGFAEEQEFRLAGSLKRGFADESIIEYRRGGAGLIPYIKIPLSLDSQDSPLKRIVVGPGSHKDDCVEAVQLFL